MARFKPIPLIARELFHYDGEHLRWRDDRYYASGVLAAHAGDVAEHVNTDGRCTVPVNGSHYHASRIIWFLATGEDPGEFEVGHRNLDTTNNRIGNLRLATSGQNNANRRKRRSANPLPKGCSLHRQTGRYAAAIVRHGRQIHLGLFDSPEAAASVYAAASAIVHKEFGRVDPSCEHIRQQVLERHERPWEPVPDALAIALRQLATC